VQIPFIRGENNDSYTMILLDNRILLCKEALYLKANFHKPIQGRNQHLNLAKQKYEILTSHKNRC
jgi:hypothetical protein